MRRLVRLGPLVFRDPLLLCGALYLLLWFDASGFLRIGLCAAVLHEMGHIFVYLLGLPKSPCPKSQERTAQELLRKLKKKAVCAVNMLLSCRSMPQ